MLIAEYARSCFPTSSFVIFEEARGLEAADRTFNADSRGPILVWRSAINPNLAQQMRNPEWPLAILGLFHPEQGWAWEFEPNREDISWPDRLAGVSVAAGSGGSPQGNTVATLRLRTYLDRESTIGNLEWWKANDHRIACRSGYGDDFLRAVLDLLGLARREGSELSVEQVSVVLSKDPGSASPTLAPTLHSDLGYGYLESAILSLLEPGFDELGGVIFMPERRMGDFDGAGPITMTTLRTKLSREPLAKTESGDLVIYSGMIGPDGQRRASNGIPHISPEVPGRSSRLSLLMRHRRRSAGD